ncbi:hypothetical protein GF336_01070 [Candidatus Woesearchaeota archaeon]|nr:hypothetical protein [Candidatus Woesearchaeota archaeon]
MEKKGFSEKKFTKYILAAYFFVFIISFSWHLSYYFYDFMTIYSVVGILFMPIIASVGLLMYPSIAFVYSLLPSQVGFIPVNLSTLYDIVALGGLFLYIAKSKKKTRNVSDFLTIFFLIFMVFLAIYHGVEISFSNYWLILMLTGGLVYFVVSNVIDNKKKLRIFVWLLILMIMAIIFRYTFYATGFQSSFAGNFDNNMFSRDLVFIVPMIIYLFWAEKNKILKGLLLVSVGLIMQNIAVMGSRASWLAIAPVLVLIGIKNIRKKSTWGFAILGILFVIFYVVSSPQIMDEIYSLERAGGGVESEDGSMRGRFEAMHAGLNAFKQRLFLGWGPSKHMMTVINYMDSIGLRGRAMHNAYLEIMVGMGLFGILLYLSLFASSFFNAYNAQRLARGKDKFVYNISWGIIFALAAFSINHAMVNRAHTTVLWIAFGLSTAVYRIAIRMHNNEHDKNINKLEGSRHEADKS